MGEAKTPPPPSEEEEGGGSLATMTTAATAPKEGEEEAADTFSPKELEDLAPPTPPLDLSLLDRHGEALALACPLWHLVLALWKGGERGPSGRCLRRSSTSKKPGTRGLMLPSSVCSTRKPEDTVC